MLDDYRNWRGTAAELGATAAAYLRDVGVDDDQELTERLVRYYVQQGVLDRPVREGREALFGYRQLLQLLVARTLVAPKLEVEKWPLERISGFNQSANEKALTDLIPHRVNPRWSPSEEEPPRPAAFGRPELLGELKARLDEAGPVAAPIGGVPVRRWLEFGIAGHCRLLVDEQFVKGLTPEVAETLSAKVDKLLRKLANKQPA